MVKKGVVTDPIGDFLTRIRNAALARQRQASSPYSKMREAVAKVLKEEGYLGEVKKKDNELIFYLAYRRRRPVITGIKNVSKPGLRIYRKVKDLPSPLGGDGIAIVSTPQGVMSDKEARKRRLGGEVLGEVW